MRAAQFVTRHPINVSGVRGGWGGVLLSSGRGQGEGDGGGYSMEAPWSHFLD